MNTFGRGVELDARTDLREYEGQTLFVYIPARDDEQLLIIEEGTGDNLLREDMDEGYVDYVNYSIGTMAMSAVDIEEPEFEYALEDGGMVMFTEHVRGKTIGDVVYAVMEDAGCACMFSILLRSED